MTSRIRFSALAIVLAVAGLVAGVGTADARETVTTREAGFELRLTPDGAGCRGIWWIVVDDLPDVARFDVTVRRISPTPATRVETFNRRDLVNPWAGTPYDYPAPAGELHVPVISGATSGACDPTGFDVWASGATAEVTRFTQDPPAAGRAAIEAVLIPAGDACTIYTWVSVPRIPTAIRYRITYTVGGASGDQPVTLSLTPAAFDPNPPANTQGVGPYTAAGRLGHYLRGAAVGAGGCTRLAWTQLATGPAPVTGASFEVTTRTCFGRQPTIIATPGVPTIGTSRGDVILGSTGRDVIRGRGGDDRICALGGPDSVSGGAGNDRIDAGAGNDVASGRAGRDHILGGSGRDRLGGGGGNDRLGGGGGDDRIDAGAGDDIASGGGGRDLILGGGGRDRVLGGSGWDRLDGGRGIDRCAGGSGSDTERRCE